MLRARDFSLTPMLALALLIPTNQAGYARQQPSNGGSNAQDVPQHQPPGTNNPDISKQRRPSPVSPRAENPDQTSPDVPQQQPGPDNNPDLGSQRNDDKTHVRGTVPHSTDTAASKGKKATVPKKRSKKAKQTATQ